MKVKIGPYKSYIGPYQIAEFIMFWKDKYKSDEEADSIHWLGDKLHSIKPLTEFCEWLQKKRHRNISIRIDEYDTWGMDYTLSLIVLPMLQQLKSNKHGSPHVDDEDVPEHLRSTAAPPKKEEWDIDDLHHDRWDWVMDEMIWAHEQVIDEDEGYSLCRKEDQSIDWDKYHEYQKRIDNGLRLFGKYYRGLWD